MTESTSKYQCFPAPNVNTLWARLLVDELARCGVRRVCISPGSRSTPLVAAFAAHEDIDDLSIIDERSAAFFALGTSRTDGIATALVCTSGTAAAHYFPAICEASRSEVPLLVLTADRPPHLHDCGASQAMSQTRLYGDHVRWFHQLGQAEATPKKLRYMRSVACRAFAKTRGPSPGPVHLNIPFRKPLEPIEVPKDHRDYVDPSLADKANLAVFGRPDGAPFVDISQGRQVASSQAIASFVDKLREAQRPLILAGADHRGSTYAQSLHDLAHQLRIPILAEPTSALRHRDGERDYVISTGDFLFESSFYQRVGDPDLIIRTGRAPLLWSAQSQVRTWAHIPQITVGARREIADPDHLVSQHIDCDEAPFFDACCRLLDEPTKHTEDGRWFSMHRQADDQALDALGEALGILYDEPTKARDIWAAAEVWDLLGDTLADHSGLFVSNSMPIRDVDTFMCRTQSAIEIYFNRGINGIDGTISTGLAIAYGRQRDSDRDTDRQPGPMVIVVGDVALRHDLSALVLAEELQIDATIVVIDNDGGAIFEYLPIADFGDLHDRHFATASRRPIDDSAVGATTLEEPKSVDEFRRHLKNSMESSGTQILRMRTDRRGDKEVRQSLRNQVADAVDLMISSQKSN